ncbi:MAG: hypothetical protein ACXV1K_06035 [Kineosporiaceae bacterium]
MSSRAVFRAGLLVVAAVALAAAAAIFRRKRTLADATVDDIEAQLEALDPATRAAVVARLAKSAADRVRGRED